MDNESQYIEMTPQILAVLTIERIASYIDDLRHEPAKWWFAIQDFDLALYSQLIASLSGPMQLGALTEDHQKIMLDYCNSRNIEKKLPIDKNGKPLEAIASFKQLLNRSLDSKFHFIDNSEFPLILNANQEKDILKLHAFRNNLAHVRPKSWHVEITGLPRMAQACTFAIYHLFKHCTVRFHLTGLQINKNEKNLTAIAAALDGSN